MSNDNVRHDDLHLGEPADPVGRVVSSTPILETKLYAPHWRGGLLSRPRLIEKLGDSHARKLTLISAPAGFGKTTLLVEWLTRSTSDRPVAWLSLDQNDSQPTSFWTYVIAALQTIRPEFGAGMAALLQSNQAPPMEALLVGLINEIGRIPQEFVLVLDDYHLIDALPIHEGISFLLDHLPSSMHLVITSRTDPPLPLARLRARAELAEIRASDLRFTPSEASTFLSESMGLQLSVDDLNVLEARTEGWIAGLQLAALSMQGRKDVSGFIAAFGGDDRYIVDYLVEEVLQRQPRAVRRFLLQTSVLDRLSGPLCDAVTGDEGGRGMLESLERGNLFVVPLDDRRRWYRYHHLFADVLRAHLQDEEPDLVRHLHHRASEWYEENLQQSDAIRHALAANDLPRAAGLVELAAQTIVRGHQLQKLVDWIKPIPDALIRSMPVLSTYYAIALQGVGELEASASRLSDAESWLDDSAPVTPGSNPTTSSMVVIDQEAFQSLPSRIALARSYLAIATGDLGGTVEHARRGLALLPTDEYHWRGAATGLLSLAHWASGDLEAAQKHHADGLASLERAGDILLALSSAYHEGDLLKARGRLTEAGKRYVRSLHLATQYGDSALLGVADLHFGLSELYCEQNDLGSATQHLHQGEALANSGALPRTSYRRCLAGARLRRTQGDLDGALDLLEEAERLHIRGAVPDVRPIGALQVRIWLLQGRIAEALGWTREQGLGVDDDLSYRREFLHITLVRVLLSQSESLPDEYSIDGASRLLERLLEAAKTGGRMAAVIEILMLQALVYQANGDVQGALIPLERALALAEPEGYVRIFVDEGRPMSDLLAEISKHGTARDYAGRLLEAFHSAEGSRTVKPGNHEALSERELEVLRLLATDLDGPDIARELVVSLNTMRTHTKNIYAKLGVSSRREAVRRAAELRLL